MKLEKIQIFSPWPGANSGGIIFFASFFGVVTVGVLVVVAALVFVDACRALAAREMLTDSRPSCSVIDRSGLGLMASRGGAGGAKLCRRRRRSTSSSFAPIVRALSRSISICGTRRGGCNVKLGEKFLITCMRWARGGGQRSISYPYRL